MLARLARAGGTVVVAAVLVFSVPISAQALIDPIPVGQFVLGAVRSAAPIEAAASTVGPEGTLIVSSLVALGALAYATKDTWMPWASGVFGNGGASQTGGSASIEYVTVINVDPGQTVVSLTYAPAGGRTFTLGAGATIQCKDTTTGALTSGGLGNYAADLNGSSWTSPSFTCPTGSRVQSVATFGQDWDNHVAPTVNWGAPFDPRVGATYSVDTNCVKPDGSTATISATTTNPGTGGLLVPSCAAAFGPDTHSTGWKVNGAPNGGTQKELSSTTIPQTSTLYPNCVGAGVACSYVVQYNGVACVVGQAECVDWSRREALGIGGQYSCRFGEYSVGLAGCAVDERVYEPGGVALTKLNTDGNPWTYDKPVPAWAPAPAADPAPIPPGAPGGDPAPIPPGNPLPAPPPTPTTSGDCWPSGSAAWNPVDWVLRPVQCALSWAFVPSTATVGTLANTAKTDLTAQGIAPIAATWSLMSRFSRCCLTRASRRASRWPSRSSLLIASG